MIGYFTDLETERNNMSEPTTPTKSEDELYYESKKVAPGAYQTPWDQLSPAARRMWRDVYSDSLLKKPQLTEKTQLSEQDEVDIVEGKQTLSGKSISDPVKENTVDMVNHPPHYKSHPSGIECIEVVRHMSFNIGNAIKYIWRCEDKNNKLEDLKKALWYIQDEIQLTEKRSKANG